MRITYYKLTFLLFILITTFSCAHKPNLQQSKHMESSSVWQHTLDNKLASVYFTPGGLLSIVTQDDNKEKALQKWYFNPNTGTVVWTGAIHSSEIVADTPFPLFLEMTNDGKEQLVCMSPDERRELWRKQPHGIILYAGTIPEEKMGFIITVPKPLNTGGLIQETIFSAFSIDNGIHLFDIVLGKLSLMYITPDDIVSFSNGIAYFAYGQTAAALSINSGELIWKETLSASSENSKIPINHWHAVSGGTVFVSGNSAYLFSAHDGVLWKTDLEENVSIRSIAISKKGLLLSCWIDNSVGVTLLDMNDGKVLWNHYTAGEKKKVISPNGILATNEFVLYSVDKKLIAVNSDDGSERFITEIDVKDKVYTDFKLLLDRSGKAVLIGNWNIRAYDIANGSEAWSFIGFETPLSTFNRYMQFGMALMAGSMAAHHTVQAGQTQGYSWEATQHRQYHMSQAYNTWVDICRTNECGKGGAKWWNRDWNLNMAVMARDSVNRELSSVMEKSGHSLNMIGLDSKVKPGVLRGGIHPMKFTPFMNSLQKKLTTTFEGNIAVINMETGSTATYPILSGGTQCSPLAFVDSSISWAVQIYEKVGFFCKKTKTIDILKLQPID